MNCSCSCEMFWRDFFTSFPFVFGYLKQLNKEHPPFIPCSISCDAAQLTDAAALLQTLQDLVHGRPGPSHQLHRLSSALLPALLYARGGSEAVEAHVARLDSWHSGFFKLLTVLSAIEAETGAIPPPQDSAAASTLVASAVYLLLAFPPDAPQPAVLSACLAAIVPHTFGATALGEAHHISQPAFSTAVLVVQLPAVLRRLAALPEEMQQQRCAAVMTSFLVHFRQGGAGLACSRNTLRWAADVEDLWCAAAIYVLKSIQAFAAAHNAGVLHAAGVQHVLWMLCGPETAAVLLHGMVALAHKDDKHAGMKVGICAVKHWCKHGCMHCETLVHSISMANLYFQLLQCYNDPPHTPTHTPTHPHPHTHTHTHTPCCVC